MINANETLISFADLEVEVIDAETFLDNVSDYLNDRLDQDIETLKCSDDYMALIIKSVHDAQRIIGNAFCQLL